MAGRKLTNMLSARRHLRSQPLKQRLANDFGKNFSSPFARLDLDDFFYTLLQPVRGIVSILSGIVLALVTVLYHLMAMLGNALSIFFRSGKRFESLKNTFSHLGQTIFNTHHLHAGYWAVYGVLMIPLMLITFPFILVPRLLTTALWPKNQAEKLADAMWVYANIRSDSTESRTAFNTIKEILTNSTDAETAAKDFKCIASSRGSNITDRLLNLASKNTHLISVFLGLSITPERLLTLACKNKVQDLIRALSNAGVKLDTKIKVYLTRAGYSHRYLLPAICHAYNELNENLIKTFIELGANPITLLKNKNGDLTLPSGQTALEILVRKYLEAGKSGKNVQQQAIHTTFNVILDAVLNDDHLKNDKPTLNELLACAIRIKASDKIQTLLDNGADPNHQHTHTAWVGGDSQLIQTPVTHLAIDRCPDALDILLDTDKVDLTATDQKQNTLFHKACEKGDDALVERLLTLDKDKKATDMPNKRGRTALHSALSPKGDEDKRAKIVGALIDAGANIEFRANNEKGWTPLYRACFNKQYQSAMLLVKRGADPTAIVEWTSNKRTYVSSPLHKIYEQYIERNQINRPLLLKLLRQMIDKISPEKMNFAPNDKNFLLTQAILDGRREVRDYLLEKGADIQTQTESQSPFHAACEVWDTVVLEKWFVSKGKHDTNDLHHALSWACHHQNEEWVNKLVDAGADIDAPNNQGLRPLHRAAGNEKATSKFIKFLLEEKKARVDATSTGLLKKGIMVQKVNIRNDYEFEPKQTALHWACYMNNAPVVQTLLEHDANPIAKTGVANLTPLPYCTNQYYSSSSSGPRLDSEQYEQLKKSHFTIIDLLKSKDPSVVSMQDHKEQTPLFYFDRMYSHIRQDLPTDIKDALQTKTDKDASAVNTN